MGHYFLDGRYTDYIKRTKLLGHSVHYLTGIFTRGGGANHPVRDAGLPVGGLNVGVLSKEDVVRAGWRRPSL